LEARAGIGPFFVALRPPTGDFSEATKPKSVLTALTVLNSVGVRFGFRESSSDLADIPKYEISMTRARLSAHH
jgi:hypothetical protein